MKAAQYSFTRTLVNRDNTAADNRQANVLLIQPVTVPAKSDNPKESNWSKFMRWVKGLSIPGQREVDRLTQLQIKNAAEDEIEVVDKEWEKRKDAVQKRIEQYKASGH